jgi:YegS/Rv2252/BmrU family lipid kinase
VGAAGLSRPRPAALRRVRLRLGRLDKQLLAGAAARRSPAGDLLLTAASTAANRSMLWLGVAGALAATGKRQPRTAAASGLLGIGVAATLVNGPLKLLWRRDRPPIDIVRGSAPLLPLPRTFSFPSGHSASALAFATGVTAALPAAGPVVLPMAAAVAYSRVHTGVHYPSDVLVGAAVGVGSGIAAARIVSRLRKRSVYHLDAPSIDVTIARHAVLLCSEHAGSAAGLASARDTLENAGWHIDEVIPVEDASRLAALLAAASDPPLVIAAGGDGTVGTAADAIAGSEALLAIIPLGTSNDVARSLGISPDPVEAAEVIATGRVVAVDAARIDYGAGMSRVFLNAATMGLNVAFAELATDPSLRERLGRLTYPIAAARAVRGFEPFECTIEHGGRSETFSLVHLSVSDAPVFGGVLGMRVPEASLTDGRLDIIAIERLSIARLILAVADTVIGRHAPVHNVHTMRSTSIRVSAPKELEIAIDGEVLGVTPAEFSVLLAARRVVVPRG